MVLALVAWLAWWLEPVSANAAQATAGPSWASAGEVKLTLDLAATGRTISNKFSDLNVWMADRGWSEKMAACPRDYFKTNFPFVRRVQLMAATGGNAQRDLFQAPNDRATLTDYDFSGLLKACEVLLDQGLKPMIKTGWVPLKFSAHPRVGAFGTNVRPPDDYAAYEAYIRALCQALKSRFGIQEVKQWWWGVGVEYENRDWFEAQDGTPESTKRAYFRLYDHTVAALEEVLGPENVIVGAHSMTVAQGFWDEGEFIEHCARGRNFKTGRQGTHLDFLAVSYYTERPGFDPQKFAAALHTVRAKAEQVGLRHLKYGVDEGRVLNGWDGRVLYPREVEHPIQAANDAKLFQMMVEQDVDYFSTWCLTSGGLIGGVASASANLRNLAWRLTDSARVAVQRSGAGAGAGNEVNCVAGYDARSKTLRVLLYNFNRNADAAVSENVRLAVAHCRPAKAGALRVRSWVLDDEHGNWWRAWQADLRARGMTEKAFRSSSSTLYLPAELAQPRDVAFWNSRQSDYEKLARMECVEQPLAADIPGTVTWRSQLKAQAVVLCEIPSLEVEKSE